MRLITTTAELADFSKAMATGEFVAVDTEFMRDSTYWPKLCLVQAAGAEGEAIIDQLAEGLDHAPFLELMNNPSVLKVFHAARQDLEIFLKLSGKLPTPLFDTQIAGMASGHGDSIAYDALVQSVLKRRLDKSSRFTVWARRPLSDAQLTYALADVTHLRDLYPKLKERLEAKGRAHWLDEELAGLLDPSNYDLTPENAWKRLKLRKTSPDYVLALQVAAAWRETEAQRRDTPRARVMKDDGLYDIAENRPKDTAAFDRMRAVPKGFGNSRAARELVTELAAAFADQNRDAPQITRPPPPPSGVGPTVELLKVLLRFEAERAGVAPRLIANSAEIELIAADDNADAPALQGWRREVFGERALALKHGRIALKLVDGKVAVEDLR
jgi:ribonuclease D